MSSHRSAAARNAGIAADRHVGSPQIVRAAPDGIELWFRCKHYGRTWHLEHFHSEDGLRYFGCSWILD